MRLDINDSKTVQAGPISMKFGIDIVGNLQ